VPWARQAAEILLGKNVGGDLAPARGDFNIRAAEDDRAVRVLDFARHEAEFNGRIRRLASLSVTALDTHGLEILF